MTTTTLVAEDEIAAIEDRAGVALSRIRVGQCASEGRVPLVVLRRAAQAFADFDEDDFRTGPYYASYVYLSIVDRIARAGALVRAVRAEIAAREGASRECSGCGTHFEGEGSRCTNCRRFA